MEIQTIYVDDLVIRDRLRAINEDAVSVLMESIKTVGGVRSPIAVRWEKDDDGDPVPVLVAGHHRVEACKRLDIEKIDSIVVQDEREARLWEIAENLHRSELTVQERADHIAEWVALTEDKMAQIGPFSSNAKVGAGRGNEGGVRAAVRDLGLGRTDTQRAIKIAGISQPARRAADEAGLVSQAARLEIAKAQDQVAKVADLKRQAEERKAAQKSGDDIVQRDAADDAAQMIVDYVPEHCVTEMLGYLDASGAVRVARSIRRILKIGDRVGSDRPVFDSTYSGAA